VAGAGDVGGQPIYPAMSPKVLAVGGTNLLLDSAGNYDSESAWSSGGGGISAYEPRPAYQDGWFASSAMDLPYANRRRHPINRAGPDVAYSADAVSVRDTYGFSDGWTSAAGTSSGAAQWAAIVAIVDQGLAAQGLGSADGGSQFLPALYGLSTPPTINAHDLHDITTGSAGNNPAKPGFDLATGLGTPVANNLIPDLVSQIGSSPNTTGTTSGSSNGGTVGVDLVGTAAHQGQAPRTAPVTPQVQLLIELLVGSFALSRPNGQAVIPAANVLTVSAAPRSSPESNLSTPASSFYPLTPPRLANSNMEAQSADVMPPADAPDNRGGADQRRDAPRPAPAPGQAAITAAPCDEWFAHGDWFRAMSDPEVEARDDGKAWGSSVNPVAIAVIVVGLSPWWRARKEEAETYPRRSGE
jgi:hypothetical protein